MRGAFALAECMDYNVKEFKEKWDSVYVLRLAADYDDRAITQEEVNDCRNTFYEILKRIDNG